MNTVTTENTINYLAGDARIDDIINRAVSAAARELDSVLPGADNGGFSTQHCGRLEQALRAILRDTSTCIEPSSLCDHRGATTGTWVIARRGSSVWSYSTESLVPTVEVWGDGRWVDEFYALTCDAVYTSVDAAAADAVRLANREGVSLTSRGAARPLVIRPFCLNSERVLGDVWTLPTR
jgi:hypothetical protein